jgi:hypothetical protein
VISIDQQALIQKRSKRPPKEKKKFLLVFEELSKGLKFLFMINPDPDFLDTAKIYVGTIIT